jgi:hypothetical protein
MKFLKDFFFVLFRGSRDVSPNAQLHCLLFVAVSSMKIQLGLAVGRPTI